MSNFNLFINDPAVPITKTMPLPNIDPHWPKFATEGFTGNSGLPESPENQAAIVSIFMAHTLQMFQNYMPSPITKWAAAQILAAVPRAGKQLNAFYDRYSLRFYYEINPLTKKIVFLCESSDVVCHEFGHACLDAIRPDIWNNPAVELFAFHESFADCLAILSTLYHSEMISFILAETKGNMRISNSVSKLAEEMGECLAALHPNSGRPADFLRNAVNPFRYVSPSELPNCGPESRLTKEGHNFSRIFTAAFYDAIVNVYESLVASGMAAEQALAQARDNCGKALIHGITGARLTPRFFESVARAMVSASFQYKITGTQEMMTAFVGRGIIDSSIVPLSFFQEEKMDNNLPPVIKLSDFIPGKNPLYDVEVEMPSEQKFGIHAERNQETDEALKATKEGLDYLAATDKVCYNGKEIESHEFRIENGKLIRSHMQCW